MDDAKPIVRAMLSYNPNARPRKVSRFLNNIFPDVADEVMQWLQTDHCLQATDGMNEAKRNCRIEWWKKDSFAGNNIEINI